MSLLAAQVSVLLCHPHHCIPSAASCFSRSASPESTGPTHLPGEIPSLLWCHHLHQQNLKPAGKAEASFIPALSQVCLQGRLKGGTGLLYLPWPYQVGKDVVSVTWCWAEQGSYIHAACTCSGWASEHSMLQLSCWMPNQLWAQAELASSLQPACGCVFYSLTLKHSMPWQILSASSWFSHEKNEPS